LYVPAVDPSVVNDQVEAEPDLGVAGNSEADDAENLGVDIPQESDAPPEVRGAFWSLVIVFNAAILAMAVGAMFVGFQGRLRLGGGLMVAGALAFAVGARRVRDVKQRLARTTDAPADSGGSEH